MKDKDRPDHLKKYIGVSTILHFVALILSTGVMKCSNDEIILPPSIQVQIVAPPSQNKTKGQPKPTPPPKEEAEPLPEKKLPKKVEETKTPAAPKVNLEEEKKKKEEEKLKKKKELEKKIKIEKEKKEELEKRKKLEKQKKAKDEKKKKDEELKKKKTEEQKKIKEEQKNAINRLKQKEALKKLIKKQPTATSGDRISDDTFNGLDLIQFQKYYGDIKSHLFNNWSLPQWLSELDLKAQALVVIDNNGYVIKREIIKSSGNSNFDNTVLAAIDKSSPFPVAPNRLKEKINNKEIIFGFPEN